MGYIIIGIVLAVILLIVSFWKGWENVLPLIAGLVFVFGLLHGLYAPGTPFEKTLVNQIQIVNLSDGMHISGGGNLFYVRVNSNNSYSYYYEVESEFKQLESEKSYRQGTVVGDSVTIVEYEKDSDEKPALYKYESGTRGNFWTFAIDGKRYEYVFRVPKGTVVQNFELNGR